MPQQILPSDELSRAARRQLDWALLLIFLLVLVARIAYVSLYAGDLPFWDQWDGEADTLLRPWVEHTWRISELFRPHAEHRIAFTRLLTLALFEANNGQWDNLVETYVGAGIYAVMTALLYARLCREEVSPFVRWITLVIVVLLAMLPFDWENTLVGFQSQFYLMGIFAILMVGLMASAKPSRSTLLLELILGSCSLFTMASGLLSAAAVIVLLLLRAWCERWRPVFVIAMATSMAMLMLGGLMLIPAVPVHDGFAAKGLLDHITALATVLMWPLQSYHLQWSFRCLGALLLWAPMLIELSRVLRRRSADKAGFFGLGMAAWVLLQAMAIAHSRGHDMTAVPSRYLDILAIGLLLNLWFAARLVFAVRRHEILVGANRVIGAGAVLFVLIAVFGLVHATRKGMSLMRERHDYVVQQTRHVFDYITSGNVHDLQQPFLLIPYPDWQRLRLLLDNPAIRAMLPPSIRSPLNLDPSSPVRHGFNPNRLPKGLAGVGGRLVISSYREEQDGLPWQYAGPVLRSSFPYVQFWLAGNRVGDKGIELKLVSDEPGSSRIALLRSTQWSGLHWRHAYVATPGRSFHVEARDADSAEWFGFSAPVESGRLSMLAHSLQDLVRRAWCRFGVCVQPSL